MTVLLLASQSPQRRAILEQLRIPFDVLDPLFLEDDDPDADPVELVRSHAQGKARSLLLDADRRPILGVDTTVALDGRVFAKAATSDEAGEMLWALAGRTHEVVSGMCLLTDEWEELHHETTRVTFRKVAETEIEHYLASGEWRERAGAYAIQGLGASLVERIEGDYLNVVGLPGALLVRLLGSRFPGRYGFGPATSKSAANALKRPLG